MERLIAFCVLLFHLGLAASFPFPDGYNLAYEQPVQQYQYSSFSQPQRAIQQPSQHYSHVASYQNANPAYGNQVAYPNSYTYPTTHRRPNYGYMYETRHDPVVAQEHQAYNEQLVNQIRLQNNKQQVHATSEPYVNSASVQSHAQANNYNNIKALSHEDSFYYPSEQQVTQVNPGPQWTSNSQENSYVQSPVNEEIQPRSPEPTQAPTNPFQQIYHHYLNQRQGQASQPIHWTNLWKKYSNSSPPKHESKRYLVIHPDGRTEYVDHIETVAKKHPNYVLVNAGSYTANNVNPTLAQTNIPLQDAAQSAPPHNYNSIPTQLPSKPAYMQTNEKNLPPIQAQPIPEFKPISVPNDTKATATASVSIAAPTKQPPAQSEKSTEPTPSLGTNPTPTTNNSNVTIPPTTKATAPKKATPPTDTIQSNTSASTDTSSVTPTTPPNTLPPSKPAPTNTNRIPSSPNTKSPDSKSTPAPATTSKSTNIPETARAKATASAESNPATAAATKQAKPHDSPAKSPKSPVNSSSSPSSPVKPEIKSEMKPKSDKPSTTTTDRPPKPTKPPTSPPKEQEKPTKPEKSNTPSKITPPPGILDLTKINTSEPITWFKTTDDDVISKLIGDEPYSVVYFIQVKSPAVIEKDTTITVFPNGSKVEEIVETVKDSEDAEPIQTKTVRRIPPTDKKE